jgi:hypothetical protein
MPWGEGIGAMPPMRPVTGQQLIRMIQETSIHCLVGSEDLEGSTAAEPWHDFADLFRDALDSLGEFNKEDADVLASQVDIVAAELKTLGVKVLAGQGGQILFVAVLRGDQRSLPALFASC